MLHCRALRANIQLIFQRIFACNNTVYTSFNVHKIDFIIYNKLYKQFNLIQEFSWTKQTEKIAVMSSCHI